MSAEKIEQEDMRKIEQLANRGGGLVSGLSPNDVLVQIALPLVLILAIATRLITMSQAIMDRSQSAVLLDLWKQQLILRMEQVLGEWEQSAGLNVLEDPGRISWEENWPDDTRLSRLFSAASVLNDMDQFSLSLYRAALHYQPSDESAADAFFPLHDPKESDATDVEHLPEDFVVTPERRAFALQYLEERAQRWSDTIEAMQWDVVGRILSGLPPDDDLRDGRMARQMRRIADELEDRGFPLLDGVVRAHGEDGGE